MQTSTGSQTPLRLFCFPYAGGGAAVYRGWQRQLPASVEVCAVELPGRGKRIREQPFTDLLALVEALAPDLRGQLDRPFAFFGHSMGALIAFEMARRLRAASGVEPAHLFVSGRRAPEMPDSRAPYHRLPDAEFLEKLRYLNGTPIEVLAHPELMELMLPVLRADFQIVESYSYAAAPPLNCPVTAFGGLRDADVRREHLEPWRAQTTGPFILKVFDGDHFFLRQCEPLLLRELARELHQLSQGRA